MRTSLKMSSKEKKNIVLAMRVLRLLNLQNSESGCSYSAEREDPKYFQDSKMLAQKRSKI